MRQGIVSIRGLVAAVVMAACQPSQSGSETTTLSPSAAAVTPSAEADTPTPTPQPFSPGPTLTPEPTLMPTSTPQPFNNGCNILPIGARMQIGMGYLQSATPSPDGTMLAVGTVAGVYVYRLEGFDCIWQRYTDHPVLSIQWSLDGKRLLTGSSKWGRPILWDGISGERLLDPDGWYSGAWTSDGARLAVAASPSEMEDGQADSVRIYDTGTGAVIRTLDIPSDDWLERVVFTLAWSPDGQLLAGGSFDGIYIWNAYTGEVVHQPLADFLLRGDALLAFSPDGGLLSVEEFWGNIQGARNTVPIWDTETGQATEFALGLRPNELRWSPDGSRAAVLGQEAVIVFDVKSGTPVYTIPAETLSIAWSPDGKYLALATPQKITIVDASSGERVREWAGDGYSEWSLDSDATWFPDNRRLLTRNRHNLVVWDAESGSALEGFSTNSAISKVAWTPDSSVLILSLPDGYQFWDAWTGTMLPVPPVGLDPASLFSEEELPQENVVSPGGTLRAVITSEGGCGDGPFGGHCFLNQGHLIVRDATTGHMLFEAEYPDAGITALAWSPDGTLLALALATYSTPDEGYVYGMPGNDVIVIDVTTAQQIFTFSGHSGNVFRLVWSPNSDWLASASADTTVIVWNVPR